MTKLCKFVNVTQILNFLNMEELKKEAIEAFKKEKGELPADAGYPVVREQSGEVYFSHSLEDWQNYLDGQKSYATMFKLLFCDMVVLLFLILVGIGYNLSFALVITACLMLQIIPIVYTILVLNAAKRNHTDLYVYVGYKKKLYAIE